MKNIRRYPTLNLKGASTLCRAAECNNLQLCGAAKVARMPPMWSRPHEKRTFCRPSGYKNCGMRHANFVWFFISNWPIPFWNALLVICHAASFDATDNSPIKFLGCAVSNSMLQPGWCNIYIYLRHGATFATWHSVDVPLRCIRAMPMPRGRIQQIAAFLRGKSCLAYIANSIASSIKNNFLERLQKLWNETSKLRLIFSPN